MVHEITDKEFEQKILKEQQHALIDIWAPWCIPCKSLAPIIEKLSEKYTGKCRFYKLNIDKSLSVTSRYKVMSVPTLLIMKDGEVVDTIVGLITEKALSVRLDRHAHS